MNLRKRQCISQIIQRFFQRERLASVQSHSFKKVLHIPFLLPNQACSDPSRKQHKSSFVSYKRCVHSSDIHLFHYQRLYVENVLKRKKIRRWKINAYVFFLYKRNKYAMHKNQLLRPLFKRVKFYQDKEKSYYSETIDSLRNLPPL